MTSPLVSIVIPCYNHAEFVQETIRSVIEQCYKNIELIIIDDGSKDNSVEKIEQMIQLCESRFSRFEFRSRKNNGLCATLNEALGWCKGDYFSVIASDDILFPHKTTLQVDYLNKNIDTVAVFGGIEILYTNGLRKKIVKKNNSYKFKDIFLHNHNLPAPTALIKLDCLKKIGGYKKELIIEDWSMWLFLTETGGRIDYLDQVLSCYRRHPGNLSGQIEKMHEGRLQIINLFSNNKYYSLAMANIFLIHADEVEKLGDKIKMIITAFMFNGNIFFQNRMYKTIVKLLINKKNY